VRKLSLVCLLLCAWSWGQSKTDRPVSSSPQPATGGANVITIKGLCSGAETALVTATTTPCQTVITPEAFEKLAAAIQPNMTPSTRRQLAETLPRLLVMAQRGEQLGLDRQDRFQELLAYARLQILSQELMLKLQERSAQIPEKDIEEYYRQHPASFERATFERILIPKSKQAKPASVTVVTKPEDAVRMQQENSEIMTKEAERLHERAVAGEDFTKLQQAAYDAAAVDSAIPTTKFADMRRAGLPNAHLSVFDLKVGEVSAVISDGTGHYIYKLEAKEMMPLEESRPEIHTLLQKERLRELMKEVQESATAELNRSYFEPAPSPEPPVHSAPAHPDTDQD
jgi:parvulin-like peptidyl-prolyl cis-trans isomerase-like protein